MGDRDPGILVGHSVFLAGCRCRLRAYSEFLAACVFVRIGRVLRRLPGVMNEAPGARETACPLTPRLSAASLMAGRGKPASTMTNGSAEPEIPNAKGHGALDPVLMMLVVLAIAIVLTWIIPSGTFDRAERKVVPGTYHVVQSVTRSALSDRDRPEHRQTSLPRQSHRVGYRATRRHGNNQLV